MHRTVRSITSAAVLVSGLAVGLGPTPAAAAAGPAVPTLAWTACGTGFQCATARVPLDYRQPNGPTISIAVMRHQATDPAHRIGTLFVNGGGPTEQLADFDKEYTELPANVIADYDIVAFDPRGFGYSSAVQCFPTQSAEQSFVAPAESFGLPYSQDQIAIWEKTWTAFDATCAKTNASSGLLQHDSTADVARDMDLLRQAVGDPVLNYFGVSYGTLLGSIYANLFPHNVGRMVLDGNINAVALTDEGGSLPEFVRDGSAQASSQVMNEFLTLCGEASTTQCAFSAGSPAATRAKFTTLFDRLAAGPVTIPIAPPNCGYGCAIGAMMLSRVAAWQESAANLQQLWLASAASTSASRPAKSQATLPSSVYIGQEQNLAVLCSDAPQPRNVQTYTDLAGPIEARYGPLGVKWLWPSEPCADWPQGTDAYAGPWNRPTANTILLVGNTGDPDTSYASSVAMSHYLANARLLTVNGYGHTEISNPSACANADEQSYLLTGALPPAGTVCQQDINPFP